MKIKITLKKIVLLISSILLFGCINKQNDHTLDFLDTKYIAKNIENDLIFYFAKKKFGEFQEIEEIIKNKNDKKKIKIFLKNYSFYKNDVENIKLFHKKTKEKIYEKVYEEIKNKDFQDDYLFSEEKFIKKIINNGFNIKKSGFFGYKNKIIPNIKPENENWETFIEYNDENKKGFLVNFYENYSDYIKKKIIPEIYCAYFIIEYIKENEKNIFGTTIQAYKINSILIPKEKDNKTDNKDKNDLINLFIKKYLENKIELNQINNLITGLKIKNQYEKMNNLNFLLSKSFEAKNYSLVTEDDGNLKKEELIQVYKETLMGKFLETNLKENSYKKGIRFLKNKILEERKIRLKNFVKSGWYLKDDLSFGKKINEFLKNEFSNKNFETIKNKKSKENIKCINKKCFLVKNDNIANDKNVVFHDEDNFYIIEIKNTISDVTTQKIEEISEVILKNNDNYNKYKKKTLENYLIKNQSYLRFKKKEICSFFKSQYSDSFNKKIKCL